MLRLIWAYNYLQDIAVYSYITHRICCNPPYTWMGETPRKIVTGQCVICAQKGVDPDQTPQNVASDLGLHFLCKNFY